MTWLVRTAAIAAIALTASATVAEAAKCDLRMLKGVWTGRSTLGSKLADHCTIYIAHNDGRLDNSICTGVVVLPVKIVTGRLSISRNCKITGKLTFDGQFLGKRKYDVTGSLDPKSGLLSLKSKKDGRVDLLHFALEELP
jgi:hypothetical protein